MSLNVFAPNARLSIWVVILLYLTIVNYLETVVWPVVFYVIVTSFHLYDYLSLGFLYSSFNIARLVFLYMSGIILLAGCFNGNGLRVWFDKWPDYYKFEKKITTKSAYELVVNRGKFIRYLVGYIFSCILIALIPAAKNIWPIILDGPPDITDPRYILLSSGNFADYATKAIVWWPFTESLLWIHFWILMGFCFLFAYHLLVPYPFIIGIQTHIWKMKSKY